MSTSRKAKFRFHGKGICRWCGVEVKKPRRNWCSDACVDEYLLRSDPARLREATRKRDNEVCGECGRDCLALQEKIKKWVNKDPWQQKSKRIKFLIRFKAWGTHLWEADHILPVCEGGGGCGLENIRTLCRCCHKKATKALAGRRKNKRQSLFSEVGFDTETSKG
jgi:5-methylcytosine-specific restriction protein A